MELRGLIAIAVLAAMNAHARHTGVPEEATVVICVNAGPLAWELPLAEKVASGVFASAGVTIEWRFGRGACAAERGEAILIDLTYNTPAELRPGALAYALPYEGVHVRVFMDRLKDGFEPGLAPYLLAYVMVHETTHILQGISRHSESGVMKARWVPHDFEQMRLKSLGFTEADVSLIRDGLEARRSHQMAAGKAGQAISGSHP